MNSVRLPQCLFKPAIPQVAESPALFFCAFASALHAIDLSPPLSTVQHSASCIQTRGPTQTPLAPGQRNVVGGSYCHTSIFDTCTAASRPEKHRMRTPSPEVRSCSCTLPQSPKGLDKIHSIPNKPSHAVLSAPPLHSFCSIPSYHASFLPFLNHQHSQPSQSHHRMRVGNDTIGLSLVTFFGTRKRTSVLA